MSGGTGPRGRSSRSGCATSCATACTTCWTSIGGRTARRLGVVEYMTLDPKTRLVLIRRDDTQHLLLLGAAGPVVVERGIAEPAPPETALKTATTTETTNIEAAE